MATSVYSREEIALQDGTDVVLKSMPIGRLRRFMDAWDKFSDVKNDSEGFDVILNCVGIALEDNFKGKFDSLKATAAEQKKGKFLSDEYKEYLEDVIDLDTGYKVLDVCGGIKMNDPKLLEAAALAAAQQNQE